MDSQNLTHIRKVDMLLYRRISSYLIQQLEEIHAMKGSQNPQIEKFKEMLETCLCLQLRMATRLLTQFYDESLRPSGVRATQLPILVTLAVIEKATVNFLAKRLVMDRTTLGQNLKPLQLRGVVEISAGEDRRTRVVRITKSGLETVHQAIPLWDQAQAVVIKKMGQKHSTNILNDLAAVRCFRP